jgi:preprotein translocase subunit SecA
LNTKLIKRVLGDPQAATLKRLKKRVSKINALADIYKKMPDAKLREQTGLLKKRLEKGASLDSILEEAFALVREASRPVKARRWWRRWRCTLTLWRAKARTW